ncbi:MAG: hypothetical protein HY901_13255, partial [Deltaproteobacteria bacterium]|nr:hypothetical protein [Deltaproteobacteria bacterium]
MRMTRWLGLAVVGTFALSLSQTARAENFEILEDRTNSQNHGYTVIRVWGTHFEMGQAIGRAFAQELHDFMPELRAVQGYSSVRSLVANAVWPAEVEEEIQGMVAGVKAGVPSSTIDAIDLKALNSFSDWSYGVACRSHSTWGGRVQAPVKTLSTRRLDFSTPFDFMLHHVVYAFEPADGSARWVNLSWPGAVTVVTAVNQHGTQASLHDYNSGMLSGSGLTFRSVAARRALTEPTATSLGDQRAQAQSVLGALKIATGTFINLFLPEGHGGVFTCS